MNGLFLPDQVLVLAVSLVLVLAVGLVLVLALIKCLTPHLAVSLALRSLPTFRLTLDFGLGLNLVSIFGLCVVIRLVYIHLVLRLLPVLGLGLGLVLRSPAFSLALI